MDPDCLPVARVHKNTVEGHDLLPAPGVVIDPLRCFSGFGDDAVHVPLDVPGDNPRSMIVLHEGQVADLHSERERVEHTALTRFLWYTYLAEALIGHMCIEGN